MATLSFQTAGGLVGVGSAAPGYTMGADEFAHWQDQAALLDPDAYEWVVGTSQARTVPAGQTYYLASGWYLQAGGGGQHFFQRHPDHRTALPVPAGRTLTTHASIAGSCMYLCKPALVTGSDARYTDDPRGLYFERIRRLASELEHFEIGGTSTNNGSVNVAFPTDFTDGMLVHVSHHDVSWIGLRDAVSGSVPPTLDEISDTDRIRFAEPVVYPFKRTTFSGISLRGATQSEGRASITYVKLPGDW